MDHQIEARRPDLVLINKKKKTCDLVDFAILADRRQKINDSGAFEIVPKDLEKRRGN